MLQYIFKHQLTQEAAYNGLLKQERRALRLIPGDIAWSWPAVDELLLEFSLPSGSYATAVLRELCNYKDKSGGERDKQ